MLLAFGPEDLERFAIPIGIGIAALLILIIPSLRRGMVENFKEGKEAGKRSAERKKREEENDEGRDGK